MAPIPLVWTPDLQKLWSNYIAANPPAPRSLKTEQLSWTDDDDQKRSGSLQFYELSDNGRTMKYTVDIIGPQPATGYPLYIGLHGGGGPGDSDQFDKMDEAQKKWRRESNDGAWYMMSREWYINGIKAKGAPAVYVAPRGIVNTWDLHFRPETYVLIERLIKDLLHKKPVEAGTASTEAPTFVDSNRVYLLGFSAGGDAVYRHSTQLFDLFGGVNVGGGHPGGVNFSNLANLPICLQVGEKDNDGDLRRMAVTANSSLTLHGLAAAAKAQDTSKPYYVHDCFIHPGQGHSGWPDGQDYGDNSISVVARAKESLKIWYDRNKNGVDPKNAQLDTYDTGVNTGAITWLNKNPRDPYPKYITWHLASRPDRPSPVNNSTSSWKPKSYCYWIRIITPSDAEKKFGDKDFITASYDASDNSVWVRETPVSIAVLLNETMLPKPYTEEVKRFFGPQKIAAAPFKAKVNLITQVVTLNDRGDPNLVFPVAVPFSPSMGQAKL